MARRAWCARLRGALRRREPGALMGMSSKIAACAVALTAVAAIGMGAARAETGELRVSKGFGLHYMPLYIMEKLKLVEKHAAAAGLGDVKVSYRVIDGGNVINDAMLAGVLDIATGGVPGFLTLWDKTRTIAQFEARGLSGIGGGAGGVGRPQPQHNAPPGTTPHTTPQQA